MTDLIENAVARDNWPFNSNNSRKTASKGGSVYFASKRIFDVFVSCAAVPVFLVLCVVITVLNFFWNPGPLFFRQVRMGKDQHKYKMIKFRTMLPEDNSVKQRDAFDKLEKWRITPFGRWMRQTRMDEVPQILNVIMGQMSLIGPRPEIFKFAETYYKEIPGYHVRGTVRPGITGYAQVTQGYTDCKEAVRVKTELDTFYVQNMNWWLDLKVLFGTFRVVLTSDGAR
ncbi:MAG: sugar transferase [Paracoccaceae bacterium]